LAKKIYL